MVLGEMIAEYIESRCEYTGGMFDSVSVEQMFIGFLKANNGRKTSLSSFTRYLKNWVPNATVIVSNKTGKSKLVGFRLKGAPKKVEEYSLFETNAGRTWKQEFYYVGWKTKENQVYILNLFREYSDALASLKETIRKEFAKNSYRDGQPIPLQSVFVEILTDRLHQDDKNESLGKSARITVTADTKERAIESMNSEWHDNTLGKCVISASGFTIVNTMPTDVQIAYRNDVMA